MKKNLIFDFTVDKENRTLYIKREFDAELALVWDAYTKQEILELWWAPKPWKVKTRTMEFREGGFWHYAMVSPEGEEHWSMVRYQKIHPQKSYTAIDGFCDEAGNQTAGLPVMRWEVTFTQKNGTTIVDKRLSFDDLAQLEQIIEMGFREGITMTMNELDVLLPELKKNSGVD